MAVTGNASSAGSTDPERGTGPARVAQQRGAVTMRDVARVAGVSVATVSHVVNDKPGARIGDEARQRVEAAVAALGYRPNVLAKTLSKGSSRFVGLVADAIATTPYAGQIIQGAQVEAWRQGYVLLVANTDGDPELERDAISMMLEHKVRGVLYSAWYHREVSVPPMLAETTTVLVNCFDRSSTLPAVVPDEYQGGRSATELLLAAGHTRVAFVNTTTSSPARVGRLRGYRKALDSAGLPYDPDLVFATHPDQGGGYNVARRIAASGATAVFCHNDRVAMGLFDGLRELGISVPDDVSVVGFDNQEAIAAHLRPGLTTIALPHYELGRTGVEMLLDGVPAKTTRIACPAVIRQSITVRN